MKPRAESISESREWQINDHYWERYFALDFVMKRSLGTWQKYFSKIDGIVRHNLIKASIRENWKVCVCVCVCVVCMWERERNLWEGISSCNYGSWKYSKKCSELKIQENLGCQSTLNPVAWKLGEFMVYVPGWKLAGSRPPKSRCFCLSLKARKDCYLSSCS